LIPYLKCGPSLVSLIYPATCLGCESRIDSFDSGVDAEFAQQFCAACWKALPHSTASGCPKCGSYIKRPVTFGDRCALCFDTQFHFGRNFSIGSYRGLLKLLILRTKRDMDEVLALHIGRMLGHRLNHSELATRADMLVPVPIHWRRRLKRGFHASQVIAEGVASVLQIPVQGNLLSCKRLTEKQGKLTGNKRFENVKNSFGLKSLTRVDGANVLIIDDVMTSGATLSELAKILKKAGAAEVNSAVAGRATASFDGAILTGKAKLLLSPRILCPSSSAGASPSLELLAGIVSRRTRPVQNRC